MKRCRLKVSIIEVILKKNAMSRSLAFTIPSGTCKESIFLSKNSMLMRATAALNVISLINYCFIVADKSKT